jgi:serine/threonine protein kinase
MLTPERWERLQALFTSAVDLEPDERAAFVARETTGDEELGRELNGMLHQHSRAGERIARAIGQAAAAKSGAEWIGRHFGPYRVVREIGHGGMGLVFEAVRDDLEYQKTVALKVAPWYRDTPELRERFRLERQILASLEHPNIARLIDGGSSEGVPYFVMEYVQGQPITAYCDAHHLDLASRIRLFGQVCEAVDGAHENLIVHRDLKPTNILVDESGAPKLLDFGIAKLIAPTADSSMTQAVGQAPWTPDYASPEQVRGRPVTVRTDVYSLGLVLYELLTGERAQKADISSPAALERSICELEPRLPSVAVQAAGDRSKARRLRGDLDTILAMALAKEPERRYASVAAFRDDLERFLTERPVRARLATRGYRARKFIARHQVGVAAATLVLAIAAAGVVSTLYQARRAERRYDQVRSLANAFIFDVHDRIEMLPGSTEARKSLVQTALVYLENLRSEASDDAGLSRELASGYEKIGNVQGNPLRSNLGDSAGARQSYERAIELLTPLAEHGDRLAELQLLSVLDQTAILQRAQGETKPALATWSRARGIGERLRAESPSDAATLTGVGNVYSNFSRAVFEMRDYPEAVRMAALAMDVAQQLSKRDPTDADHLNNLGSAYNTLAAAQIGAGELAAAAGSYRESIRVREGLIARDPNNAQYAQALLIGYGSLGDILGYRVGANLGDAPGAAAAFRKAIEMAERARQRDPSDRRAMFDLASAKLRLGTLLTDPIGDFEGALVELEAAEQLNGRLLAEDPKSDRFGYVAVVINRRLADALAGLGQQAQAIARYERARADVPRYLKGPNGPTARQLSIAISLRLGRLRAIAADASALSHATYVANELTKAPVDTPAVDAMIYRDLGSLYELLARGVDRNAHLGRAVANWRQSETRWRDPKVPKEMWTRRDEQLRQLQTDISRVEGLLKH